VTKIAMEKADAAARNPPGTARKAADRVSEELKKAKAEIEKALKSLE
jgi:hypothetical protein